jgi:hypothetical protein
MNSGTHPSQSHTGHSEYVAFDYSRQEEIAPPKYAITISGVFNTYRSAFHGGRKTAAELSLLHIRTIAPIERLEGSILLEDSILKETQPGASVAGLP